MSKRGSITMSRGFRAAGGTCGIKDSGKPDLMLIVADVPCSAAGVFTTNKVVGAPVIVNKRHLRATAGVARAIVCNSGISNSATGARGVRDAEAMCRAVADRIGCSPKAVMVSSTGVIGQPLPMAKVLRGIVALHAGLDRGRKVDVAAAQAIVTTDLALKSASRRVRLGGQTVHLGGIAKGSGMIAPNMATMLVFITTDCAIAPPSLRASLQGVSRRSFNRISVDEHTSPSDTVLVLASGLAGNRVVETGGGHDVAVFVDALTDLCGDLAYQIVKDGEGATRVFRVRVRRARSVADADKIGRAIVNSPLVKTAVHGADPNWGRITTAAGYSGAAIKPERMSLSIGGVTVFKDGGPVAAAVTDPTTARRLAAAMRQKEVLFTLDAGLGEASVEWLGCDLSRDYVTLNADYTT
jgi:glutamate N-acetyltransferase/amino-acid N-acetyltransferase